MCFEDPLKMTILNIIGLRTFILKITEDEGKGITKEHKKLLWMTDMFIILIAMIDGMIVKFYVSSWLGYGAQPFGQTLL